MNNITLVGRLVADAELSYIPTTGTPKGSYKIAVDRKTKGKDGKKKTDFIRCEDIGKHMEKLVVYLTKGKLISVSGELHIDLYKDKEGNYKEFTRVNVNRMDFIAIGKKETQNEPTFEPTGLDPQGFEAINDDDIPF